MVAVKLKYKRFPGYKPIRMSKGASGYDLCADIDQGISIVPMDRVRIPTGVMLEMPEGLEGQIRSRSGLALKNGVVVLNSPGTIDSDYRGEISVILINLGGETYTVSPGERIAQLVFAHLPWISFQEVEVVEPSARGSGGFGSTGG